MTETLIPYNAPKLHCTKPCPHGITIGSIEQYFPIAQEEVINVFRKRYSNTIVAVGSSICATCKYYNPEKSTSRLVTLEHTKGVVACMHP